MNQKKADDFRNWLISTQNLKRRSAGDVVSMRTKLLTIISFPMNLPLDQLKAQLEAELVKGTFTRPTLTGMVRAEKF
jgi:hypothetical protein